MAIPKQKKTAAKIAMKRRQFHKWLKKSYTVMPEMFTVRWLFSVVFMPPFHFSRWVKKYSWFVMLLSNLKTDRTANGVRPAGYTPMLNSDALFLPDRESSAVLQKTWKRWQPAPFPSFWWIRAYRIAWPWGGFYRKASSMPYRWWYVLNTDCLQLPRSFFG